MKMFAFQLGRRSAAEDSSRLTRQPPLDIGAGERASTPQVSLFDNLTRSVAGTATRRGALRVALTGLAGLALSKIGINTAWAAANCLCNGTVYDSATACCTATGVVQKNPIADLARCPGKVAHAGHTCVPNGCGGSGGIGVPNSFLAADFLPACNTHDCCYDRCNSVKATCDTNFRSTLRASCTAAYPGAGFIETRKRNLCLSTADTYFDFVDSSGQPYYDEAQRQSCDCCGTQTCQTCAGSSCGSLPRCSATLPDCLCFSTPEGAGACIPGSTPCAGLTRCTSSAQCPPGFGCAATSCCGGNSGVCGPLCSDVRPNLTQARSVNAVGPTMGGGGSASRI